MMKKIILASNSPQRKELLKHLNLKFKIVRPQIQEKHCLDKLSCSSLVKHNAEKKALNVASRLKDGVVIAADTVVLRKNKLIGKPKDRQDAFRILKQLTQNPHLVYTGLAVYDCEKKKMYSSFEKTKVFMEKMSDREIKRYINQADTSNMAGSFDIQGKGAIFIRKIEGCFYNVVGLPLAKLNYLLKKANVTLLCLALILSLGGCAEYNLATGREEVIIYSSERETNMGKNLAASVEKQFKVTKDLKMQEKVEEIGQRIASVCDRKDILYHFKVISDEKEPDMVNAFSLPGGYIYVFEELMKISNDDELAGVLGHEVGHAAARHVVKQLQAALGYTLLRLASMQAPQASEMGAGPDVVFNEIMLNYSREDEFLADKLGIKYAKEAGYKPEAMISFLEKLRDLDKKSPPRPMSTSSRTHPYTADRIRMIKQNLYGQIDFIDYYNITEEK